MPYNSGTWLTLCIAPIYFFWFSRLNIPKLDIVISFSFFFFSAFWRWVSNLLEKLCIQQCGLLLFHCLWSCWVSPPRNGLLLVVLAQCCWLLLVVRSILISVAYLYIFNFWFYDLNISACSSTATLIILFSLVLFIQ